MATYDAKVKKVCEVLCKSEKFETGEGTCAPICMGMLGEARKGCAHRNAIHNSLARNIVDALETVHES